MNINSNRGFAPIIIVIIALLVVGGAGASIYSKNKSKKAAEKAKIALEEEKKKTDNAMMAKTFQFDLAEQNKSGLTGKVVVNEENGKAKVIVNITGKSSGVPMPAHIHLSSCATIGAVKYPLMSVENGASQTTLTVSLSELLSSLPLSVNVHKSAEEPNIYVACGDIPADSIQSKSDEMMENKDNMMGSDKSKDSADMGPGMMNGVVVVEYTESGFSPKEVTINKGQTVKFVNKTSSTFSVASNPHPTHTKLPALDQWKDPKFKSQTTYEFTFTQAGKFDYHNHMKESDGGAVIVK